MKKLEKCELKDECDHIAPDGSEIYLLPTTLEGGGLALCELPIGKTSQAVCHKNVEEIWFFLEGEGQVWRKLNNEENVASVSSGTCITIPLGAHFQFRNTGDSPLRFVISTMPPWPDADEAFEVDNYWEKSNW